MNTAEGKKIMGQNFIGPEELAQIREVLGIKVPEAPEVLYGKDFLAKHAGDYILILGAQNCADGSPLTINKMRENFGIDPQVSEPCFYNQNWYLKEEFAAKKNLEPKWYLIRKTAAEETRGIPPKEIENNFFGAEQFPSAILTAFVFFAFYFLNKEYLWKNDFIWCSDRDHNGDIIYTGRYEDSAKINKDGFNIHRHLSIRKCYGAAPIL